MTMKNNKPSIALIGAGSAGTALVIALHRRGYTITAIASKTLASAEKTAALVNCPVATTDPAEASRYGKIVIIATPDTLIREACELIRKRNGFHKDQYVLHLSGATGSSALLPAKEAGAAIVAFHPIQTLSDPIKGAELLSGSYYCLEGDDTAIEIGKSLVADLQGSALIIGEQDKPLYHAALSIASNYLVTLEAIAAGMLQTVGIDKAHALSALLPLVQGSVDNLRHSGLPNALTGPISRGDVETVQSHLTAMHALPATITELYKTLGEQTVSLALEKGTIEKEKGEKFKQLLQLASNV